MAIQDDAINRIDNQLSDPDWVNSVAVLNCKSLIDALKIWRWDAYIDRSGNLRFTDFLGEKADSSEQLWDIIAPYVVSGSWIAMKGQENEEWNWNFDDGKWDASDYKYPDPDNCPF